MSWYVADNGTPLEQATPPYILSRAIDRGMAETFKELPRPFVPALHEDKTDFASHFFPKCVRHLSEGCSAKYAIAEFECVCSIEPNQLVFAYKVRFTKWAENFEFSVRLGRTEKYSGVV